MLFEILRFSWILNHESLSSFSLGPRVESRRKCYASVIVDDQKGRDVLVLHLSLRESRVSSLTGLYSFEIGPDNVLGWTKGVESNDFEVKRIILTAIVWYNMDILIHSFRREWYGINLLENVHCRSWSQCLEIFRITK